MAMTIVEQTRRREGQSERIHDGRLLGADIDSTPYDEVARLCGARGHSVDRPGQLEPALKSAMVVGRPSVMHVKIDPAALTTLRKDLFNP